MIPHMNGYRWAIEELAVGPENCISLGSCSKSTVYRWARECNEILEREKYDWRVKPDANQRLLVVVPLNAPESAGDTK